VPPPAATIGYREDHSFLEPRSRQRVVEVGDHGRLVDRAADPVAGEVVDDREAETPGDVFDLAPDPPHRRARTDRGEGAPERLAYACRKRRCDGRDAADPDRPGRVRHEAVLLRRDVELDEVSFGEPPAAGDPVHHFVVDADAALSGEAVDESRRRSRALGAEHGRRGFVEPRRGHARSHRVAHRRERLLDDS
jgi:hypothetical protein